MYHNTRYAIRLLVLALLTAPGWSAPAVAQEPAIAAEASPLLKADLVRMLALGDYTDDELVHIVRMNCVAFRPTERDRSDFLSLPGGETVLASIRDCRSSQRQSAGFDRGIPVARPVQGPNEEPAVDTPPEMKEVGLPSRALETRPELTAPRFTMVIQDEPDAVTASEVPPRLQNWAEVSKQLLREYRPNERKAGRVVLRVRVDETGRAADSLLEVSSGDPYLDAAVLSTVSVMRFTPAMSRDRKVTAWTELPIQFETP